MKIDDAINKLNKKSLFKILAFLVLSFPTFQNYGQMQSILLALVTPNYTCQYNSSLTDVAASKDQCSLNVSGSVQKCSKWNFSIEPVGTTMMSDYGLVCDKKNFADIILICWYTTSFTSIVMGWLSDKYGRKKIVILNLVIETVSSILIAFSPNVTINMVGRFFLGVSACNIYIAFVWLMESVNIDFRKFVGSFFWMYGCLAYMIFPLIVYATKNWRNTQLLSIIPSIMYIFIFFIPESPRWLVVVGKKDEAIRSLAVIGKINKLNITFEDDFEEIKVQKREHVVNPWRSKVFISRSLLTFLLQFSTAILYSGVTVNISILSNNVLLSIFLLGLMETPGLLLSYFCLHHMRRKSSIVLFGMTGSLFFWMSSFFSRQIFWQSVIRIILGCIGKATVASVNQSTMVYIAELFPTSHRSFAFVCVQLATFASFVGAVYINKLSEMFFYIPMTVYLMLMFSSCIMTFCLLPETKGLPFPETLEDQKALKIGHEQEYLTYMKNKENDEYSYSNTVDEIF